MDKKEWITPKVEELDFSKTKSGSFGSVENTSGAVKSLS